MRQAILLFLMVTFSSTVISSVQRLSHGRSDVKSKPEHIGVEAVFQPIVKSYIEDAQDHDIKFTKDVTVGMTIIKDPRTDGKKTIGLCTYGDNFREIDIDSDFWKTASANRQKILLYHELTHCYCGRDHDWGAGVPYLSEELQAVLASFEPRRAFWQHKPGYYLDECPISIMNPTILEEHCIVDHESDYLEEMWNRCKPY